MKTFLSYIAYIAVSLGLACGNITPSGDITAVNTPTAGGLTGGSNTGSASLSIKSCSSSQILEWDGDSWECIATPSAGTGDITGVTAGTGLTGGATSGNATLDIGCSTGISCAADTITLNMTAQDCTAGQFLDNVTATGVFGCVAEVGDISGVTAGSGLINGGSSGSVTLDIQTGTGITVTGDAVTLNMTGASCSAGQAVTAISATGTGTCSAVGTVTGSGTDNYFPLWNGTGALDASTMSDSGSVVTLASRSFQVGISLDVDGVYSGFGSTDYAFYIDATNTRPGFSCLYGTNSAATCYINSVGYQASTTQTRSLIVADGTGTTSGDIIATFDGVTRNVAFSQGITTTTTASVGTTLFASNATVYAKNTALNFANGTNATATGLINATGYDEGTSQFRNLEVQDGKGVTIATFTGSSKLVSFADAISTAGDATFGNAASDQVNVTGDLVVADDTILQDLLNVNGSTTLGDANADGTNIYGRAHYLGTAPTLSGCTPTCTIASYSTDSRGKVSCTDGPVSCTVTFSVAYTTNPPACVFESTTTTQPYQTSAPTTSAFTATVCPAGGCSFDYHCDGMQ